MPAVMKRRGRIVAILTGAVTITVLGVAAYLEWPNLCFRYRFEPLGANTYGLPEYRHRQTGIVFVRLPGGTFWMGAQKEDPKGHNYDPEAQEDEGPVHEVTLSPFLIAKYEVTQRQWTRVMEANPSKFMGDDNRSVENVSWNDIQEFEAKTGLTLPTEAQWEYACRAGTTGPFAGTGNLDDMGWYGDYYRGSTHSVGQKAPNGFGLYDMHGNVLEWCEDFYDDTFYSKPEAAGSDPVSSAGSEDRVIRGGGWYNDARNCRSANRNGDYPLIRFSYLGFRPSMPSP